MRSETATESATLLDDVVSFFQRHLLQLFEVVDGLRLPRTFEQRLRAPGVENVLGLLQIFLHFSTTALISFGRRHALVDIQVDVVALPVQGFFLDFFFFFFWRLFVGQGVFEQVLCGPSRLVCRCVDASDSVSNLGPRPPAVFGLLLLLSRWRRYSLRGDVVQFGDAIAATAASRDCIQLRSRHLSNSRPMRFSAQTPKKETTSDLDLTDTSIEKHRIHRERRRIEDVDQNSELIPCASGKCRVPINLQELR